MVATRETSRTKAGRFLCALHPHGLSRQDFGHIWAVVLTVHFTFLQNPNPISMIWKGGKLWAAVAVFAAY